MADPTVVPTQQRYTKAIRLLFSFDGDQVTLDSQQSVDMVLPPSDPVVGTAAEKGFWYELRDAQDHTLYRKVMHHPMRDDVEVFSDDPRQHSVARHNVPNRKGHFVVLVPDTDQGQAVTLSSNPRSFPLANQPATVIGRFALKK